MTPAPSKSNEEKGKFSPLVPPLKYLEHPQEPGLDLATVLRKKHPFSQTAG